MIRWIKEREPLSMMSAFEEMIRLDEGWRSRTSVSRRHETLSLVSPFGEMTRWIKEREPLSMMSAFEEMIRLDEGWRSRTSVSRRHAYHWYLTSGR